MAWKRILFDLDGTLTDPATGIVNSILHALKRMEISESDPAALTRFIGPPLHESFAGRYDLSTADAFRAVEYYREYFRDRGIFENRVYPEIPDLLERLAGRGCGLMLATSKPTVYAQRILDHFGLSPLFSAVWGSELDGSRTRKGDVIRAALDDPACSGAAVMVGDRIDDIRGARENNIPGVAVRWGYGAPDEFASISPEFRAEDVAELSTLLGVEWSR